MTSAALYVARKLRSLDAELRPTIDRVLAASDDEAVHDLRVAIRRTRTLLKVARPLFGKFHSDAVRRAFADVQKATGDLRDEEALEETLEKLDMKSPLFVAWRERRKARERALRRVVVRSLQAGQLTRARRLLLALLTLPVRPTRDKELPKYARRCVELARTGVEAHRDARTDDGEALHELRIAYKQLRYSLELFADALPSDLLAAREPAVRFQKKLGEIHDLDVACLTIARARGLTPATRAEVGQILVTERARKIAAYLREMNPAEVAPVTPPAAKRSGRSRPSSAPRSPSVDHSDP